MKKCFVLFLVLMLLFSSVVLAEETKNTDMGIAYEYPEGWIFLNEEALKGIANLVSQQVTDQFQATLALIDPSTMAYFLVDLTSGATVNIVCQSSNGIDFDTLFSFRSQLAQNLKSQYDEAYGITDSIIEASDTIYSFGENRYFVFHCEFMGSFVDQYATILDDSMIIISFSNCTEEQQQNGEILLSSLRLI